MLIFRAWATCDERRHECVKQRGVGNKVFVLYLRNSVLKKIPYISLIRDPLTKTLTIQTEKNCSALALYRKLETIKGSVISAFRMVFFLQKYHNTLCCPSTILHKHCFQFPLGLTIAVRKFENNVYAKCWRNNKRALWNSWKRPLRLTMHKIALLNLL